MQHMDLRAVDLNLLVTLDALLATRSVTGAARRMGRSQPAVSHALGRLRDLFGDPLLVRAGRTMTPTPRGQMLEAQVREALAAVSTVLAPPDRFDPATSRREFTVALPDLLAPLVPQLVSAAEREAPGVRLHLDAYGPAMLPALADGGCDVALAGRFAVPPSLRSRSLGTLTWATLVRQGHPLLEDPSLDRWAECRHIMVSTGLSHTSWVQRAVDAAGLQRRRGVTVQTFLLAPAIVAATDQVFSAPRELMAPLATRYGLELIEPPVAIPPVEGLLVWHERLQHDASHRWFRGLVRDVCARYFAER